MTSRSIPCINRLIVSTTLAGSTAIAFQRQIAHIKNYHPQIIQISSRQLSSRIDSSGRGAYYKEKYGSGRGGRSGGRVDENKMNRRHGSSDELGNILRRIDGKQYPTYKDIYGAWDFDGEFTLYVDYVQGDAYAAPSRMRIKVPHSISQIPTKFWQNNRVREVATRDFLARRFGDAVAKAGGDIRKSGGGWHGAKGGEMNIDRPGQSVLERTAVLIDNQFVEARFSIALPAHGRSVMGRMAFTSIIEMLPRYVREGLLYSSLDANALTAHVHSVEDSVHLRQNLSKMNLVSFVADGSILPRRSGASDEPMAAGEVIPFVSPSSMRVTVELPNRGTVQGMGIPHGVTLITGGGFHGKSTLLKAIERGVYDHIPGDGRELIVTDPTAVKIRAEDGRSISSVDIETFISDLPYGKRTNDFTTADASGSTSQAANIQEALEIGTTALLLDEDTCATNFMIRDSRMQLLVSGEKEPIKPLISRIRGLAASGVSTIMVVGGCGEFFDVADQVILMEAFRPTDATSAAKEISQRFAADAPSTTDVMTTYPPVTSRRLLRVLSKDAANSKSSVRNRHMIQFGDIELDLSYCEQIVDTSQTRAILDALKLMHQRYAQSSFPAAASSDNNTLRNIVDAIDADFDDEKKGLDVLSPDRLMGNYARPRRFEIAAAVNRLRTAVFGIAKKEN